MRGMAVVLKEAYGDIINLLVPDTGGVGHTLTEPKAVIALVARSQNLLLEAMIHNVIRTTHRQAHPSRCL
jgi:hypothetical protein